jgi:hypothetical protein
MDTNLFTSLWLAVLVSAVVVFIASSIIWMVLPLHKKDWKTLPDEDGFMRALGAMNIPPGLYSFPNCAAVEGGYKNEAFQKKWEAGPKGFISVWPAKVSMGTNLALMFVFNVVVGVFVAYMASMALSRGEGFSQVFQVCGTAAVMGYALGGFPGALWDGKPPRAIAVSAGRRGLRPSDRAGVRLHVARSADGQ